MPRLINVFLLFLIFLSNKTYGIEVDGVKLGNGTGEVLVAAPEGPHDPAGTLVYSNSTQSEFLKIRIKKNLDQKSASSAINQKIIQLASLYRPAAVPYAGAITNSIDCSKKYNLSQTPTDTKDALLSRFKLEANEQLVYGVCEDKKLIYNSEYILIYCKKNKSFFEIKYFLNKKSKKNSPMAVECI